jgi:hypothetical protein
MGGYPYTIVLKNIRFPRDIVMKVWTDNLPEDSYYWNMSMNRHQWYLHFHNEEDVVAFKLRFEL